MVIYDTQWQAIRVSLLGKFVDLTDCITTMLRLQNYIGEATDAGDFKERALRIYRVNNLLAATRMGYHGMGLVGSSVDTVVIQYQTIVSKQYKNLTDTLLKEACEEFTVKYSQNTLNDLKLLKKYNLDIFEKIKDNLNNRTKHAHKKVGTMKNRPELQSYLQFISQC